MNKDLELENENLKQELARYKDLLKKEEIDEITGLYSKNIFFAKTKQMLVENPDKNFVFIKANIDKFQLVNSFYGFEEGDRLLQYFSHRLKIFSVILPKSVIGHLGADSFVICCSDLPNNGIQPLLEKNIHSIMEGFREDFKLSVSVGIYHIEDNLMDLSLVHSRAIVALKKSKEQYGEYYTVYNESMNEDSFQKHFVINELQTAFNEQQFDVYLQPKCNLSNGKVVGAEALVRWIHPEKGIISPDNFIPILESNGFISKLDEYVWNRSCQYIRSWIDAGLPPIPISVNVSRVDLHNPELINILLEMIDKNGIDIKHLHLEITESAYSENPYQIIDTVNKLHELGFYIELDDFGTGYSSLNVLNAMKLDTLKLDMSFIKAQTENVQSSGDIINFIVRLAKQLQLAVVAEGIETSEQLAFLRGIGCEMGQGFFYSRALPKESFDEYMRNHTYEEQTIEPLDHKLLLDIDDIWFPNSKFNFLFNHFVGALALSEIKGTSGSLLRTNDEYIKLIGYKGDRSIFDKDFSHFVHPDSYKELARALKSLNSVGNSVIYTIQGKDFSKKKGYIWLKMHSKVVAMEKDTKIILSSLENIDKEIKATEKLKKTAEKQRELETQLSVYKDVGGDGVFVGKIQNGLVLEYANEQFYKMHGISKSYARNHKEEILKIIMRTEDKERVENFLNICIEKKETSFNVHFNTKTIKNENVFLHTRGHIKYEGEFPTVEIVIKKTDNTTEQFL